MSVAILPFELEENGVTVLRACGKDGVTVWTVELGIANATIREYEEPLFWNRQWCYATWLDAVCALYIFMETAGATEPDAWIRHVTPERRIVYAPGRIGGEVI